jgi:hypothetical protein
MPGNALARVQLHEPIDLWDVIFCTCRFLDFKYYVLAPADFEAKYRTDCTRRSKFLTHALYKHMTLSQTNFYRLKLYK